MTGSRQSTKGLAAATLIAKRRVSVTLETARSATTAARAKQLLCVVVIAQLGAAGIGRYPEPEKVFVRICIRATEEWMEFQLGNAEKT